MSIANVGFPAGFEEAFDVTACAKDDPLCESPLATRTTYGGEVVFDAFGIGAPFDGFFLVDGPSVYPGRLQSNFPYLSELPGHQQGIDVLPADVLDRGGTIPAFDSGKLFSSFA